MPEISKHVTLVADTITTVTITGNTRGLRIQRISETSSAPLWWSCGRTEATTANPTITGADDTYRLPAGAPPDILDDPIGSLEDKLVVKLRCADAIDASVETW